MFALLALSIATAAAAAAQQIAFDEAVRNLRHPELRTRMSAVRQLAESRYLEAAAPMALAIGDVEDAVQLEAINGELGLFLSTRAEARTRGTAFVDVGGRNAPARAFAAGQDVLAPRVVPPEVPIALAGALKDRTASVRLAAVYAFGVLAPASPQLRPSTLNEVGPALALMIRQDEAAIREGAAFVGGRVWKDCGRTATLAEGCRAVGDGLIDGMNDPDEGVRLAAMDSVGLLRYGPAVQALTERFTFHRTGRAAEIALNALARTGHPVSVPLFRTLLGDRRPNARLLGIEGLARAGDTASRPDIQKAAERRPSPETDLALAYAESKLGPTPKVEFLVPGLLQPRTRPAAREYLADLGAAAVGPLSAYLRDPDPIVRGEVARLLARIGDTAVISQIEPLLRDPDPVVASIAGVAVAHLRAGTR